MSKIKNRTHLGLLLSMLPESEIKEMIFDHGILPTYIRGLATHQIRDIIAFSFQISKDSDTMLFTVTWRPAKQEVLYKCGQGSGTYSRKSRKLDGMSWKIDLLNYLQMGWEMPRSRIGGTASRNAEHNVREFIATFDP